ncbi:DegT/DnrJ/EryC1/StrS family aminotransferase, partial [Mycobacterium sp.]|uniref:DegT/DnrJ/EryC1/StrS family aminotransferase n=1 Tax=Mycobacterium sp. TaxID=1785 RepID=UPI00333E92D9|nr:Perosamine synthetase [Mycobacterium sp.]
MTVNVARIPQVLPWIGDEERALVDGVLEDKWLTEGARSQEFASQLMELMGARYGVFAPNGTLALALGLMALEISTRDEVIVPNSTFVGSATAVLLAGAKPVFVDIDPQTLQIDVSKAEHLVTANTAAIMPVHLMGAAADMDAVMAFAKHHDLKVIEDAAQGIGVTHKGRHVGTFGDVGCFSFFADKTITTGEGGFIACQTPDVYERLRLLRNQGRLESGSFMHRVVGFNFRITDLQAAIGLAQLKKLGEIIVRKKANQALYSEQLKGNPHVRVFEAPPDSSHVPFRCVLMCDRAFELAEYLRENFIDTRRFFYPLHKQPCFT